MKQLLKSTKHKKANHLPPGQPIVKQKIKEKQMREKIDLSSFNELSSFDELDEEPEINGPTISIFFRDERPRRRSKKIPKFWISFLAGPRSWGM